MIGHEDHTYTFRFDGEAEAVAALMAAMAKAQAAMDNATKGSVNPAFRSKYADLAAILEQVRPAAAAHGLWISQPATTDDDGRVGVQTVVAGHGAVYSSGVLWQRIPDGARNASQESGKAITYARRYQLSAVWGIAQEDDDGNSLQGAPPARRQRPPQRQPSQPRQRQPSQHAADLQDLYTMLQAAGFDGSTRDGLAVTNLALGSLIAGTTIERCQGSASTTRKMLEALRGSDLATLRRQSEADHAAEGAE